MATATLGRDSNERVTSISDQNSSLVSIAAYTLTYDANGNLTNRVDHGTTTSYGYDNAGEITSANQTGSVTASYSYDAAGNRSAFTITTGNRNREKGDADSFPDGQARTFGGS